VTGPVRGDAAASVVQLAAASCSPADEQWVVLADPAVQSRAEQPIGLRRVLASVVVAAVIVAVTVGLAGSLVSRRLAEQQAVHDVAQLTDVLAESVVQPVLTDPTPTDPSTTRRMLDPIVHRLLNGSLVRVTLWM
jgi:two-component system, NarL family, sensor kinase